MNKLLLVLVVFFVGSLCVVVTAFAITAGVFQMPVDPNLYSREDPQWEYITAPAPNGVPINGFHAGEDWNANDGTDYDDLLYAPCDGRTVFKNTNPTTYAGKGRMLIIRCKLPTGVEVDHAYYHLNSITVNHPQNVARGDEIARIGDSGTGTSHLHQQIEVDLNIPLGQNPYYGGVHTVTGLPRDPMSVENGIKYTSPSLFISDRSRPQTHNLNVNAWKFFTVSGQGEYVPISTAFIEDTVTGERRSIDLAYSVPSKPNDWIYNHGIIYNKGGGWYYKNDPMSLIMSSTIGYQYAIYAYKPNLKLTILKPLHSIDNEQDRARADMLHSADEEGLYDTFDTRTFHVFNNDGSYIYYAMLMKWPSGQSHCGFTGAWAQQATQITNPLIRFKSMYDINSCSWKPWEQLDPNTLY